MKNSAFSLHKNVKIKLQANNLYLRVCGSHDFA